MRAHYLTTLLTPAVLLLGLAWLATPALAGNQKTTLCHVPPDNLLDAHEIVVSAKALEAHLRNHPGDQEGTCQQGCADASGCDDASVCTIDRCNPDGTCDYSQRVDCADGNACTDDFCDPQTGCANPPVADAVDCDDGNACSSADVCEGGACTGTDIPGCCLADSDCGDSNACTIHYCDDVNECQVADISGGCPAGACEVAYCDTGVGCTTAPVTCPQDSDICTVAVCDPLICAPAGNCVSEPVAVPPEPVEVTCGDGLDNDCDGDIDLADSDCTGGACSESEVLIFGFEEHDYAGGYRMYNAWLACRADVGSWGVMDIDCETYLGAICDELYISDWCSMCVGYEADTCDLCKAALHDAALSYSCGFDFNDCLSP